MEWIDRCGGGGGVGGGYYLVVIYSFQFQEKEKKKWKFTWDITHTRIHIGVWNGKKSHDLFFVGKITKKNENETKTREKSSWIIQ